MTNLNPIASFSVPGIPVAKGRARISVRGGFARAYTPEKTVSFENRVAHAGNQAVVGTPSTKAIALQIAVHLPIPASWSKKKQDEAALGVTRPCGRPDVDNFAKAVLDGLNGIVWRDDSQVVQLTATKHYSISPRVDVVASEIMS